jgi:hypothetical protein
MRVCVVIATGKMIESQSGDDGGLDVLVANAVAAGYAATDVQASIVTEEQFQALLAAAIIPEPQSVLSQDLIAQFTADDAAKIQAAISGNMQFWLLWSAMQAQKDPMLVTNAPTRKSAY